MDMYEQKQNKNKTTKCFFLINKIFFPVLISLRLNTIKFKLRNIVSWVFRFENISESEFRNVSLKLFKLIKDLEILQSKSSGIS